MRIKRGFQSVSGVLYEVKTKNAFCEYYVFVSCLSVGLSATLYRRLQTLGENSEVNFGRAAWEAQIFGTIWSLHVLYAAGKPRKILIQLAGRRTFRMQTAFWRSNRRTITAIRTVQLRTCRRIVQTLLWLSVGMSTKHCNILLTFLDVCLLFLQLLHKTKLLQDFTRIQLSSPSTADAQHLRKQHLSVNGVRQ
jgi:hypothetical protein